MRWSGIIAVEGEASADGRIISADALTWELAEGIPLVAPAPLDAVDPIPPSVLGAVDVITRGEDGLIIAEGTVTDESLEVGQPLAIMVDNAQFIGSEEDGSGLLRLVSGRIRHVYTAPSWPQCVVTEVTE